MKKIKFKGFFILFLIFIVGIFGFNYIYKKLNGNPVMIKETAELLKEQMEEKYGIIVIKSEGFYTTDIGYAATLTTESGITFDAWRRKNSDVNFYMEEVWRRKGIDKWGNAGDFITGTESVELNVGYREEGKKDVHKLIKPIEEVNNDLWLTIYVDLKEAYKKEKAKEIEKEIFKYYQFLQQNGAEEVELIVRYNENFLKHDTGSYMIIRNAEGKLPNIRDVEDVSETLNK
ncbi:hypothetical protein [Metabacillus fastidiosus]|uniref:hypothetical protein n=1 Tax=Metabacillus fastidiosus TaxID=1458 RepID=UPI000825B370|nr:hypothetical protein [Metabacillus fastidiosus]MED4461615.1 hypothetical protein [Metabacillus fastidiosus]